MKIFKKILLVATAIGLGAAGFGYYLFNKPHESTVDKDAQELVAAEELVAFYEMDENTANQKYLGKVCAVTGVITDKSVDEKGVVNITLKGGDLAGVTCQFEQNGAAYAESMKTGDSATIKGICTGILMDVVLVDCVVNTPE